MFQQLERVSAVEQTHIKSIDTPMVFLNHCCIFDKDNIILAKNTFLPHFLNTFVDFCIDLHNFSFVLLQETFFS